MSVLLVDCNRNNYLIWLVILKLLFNVWCCIAHFYHTCFQLSAHCCKYIKILVGIKRAFPLGTNWLNPHCFHIISTKFNAVTLNQHVKRIKLIEFAKSHKRKDILGMFVFFTKTFNLNPITYLTFLLISRWIHIRWQFNEMFIKTKLWTHVYV